MGFFASIVIGVIAGWLTGKLMKGGGYGLVGDLILGLVGSLVGGWLCRNISRSRTAVFVLASILFLAGIGFAGMAAS